VVQVVVVVQGLLAQAAAEDLEQPVRVMQVAQVERPQTAAAAAAVQVPQAQAEQVIVLRQWAVMEATERLVQSAVPQ